MSEMFCYQCQEALKNVGCTIRGVCGKSADIQSSRFTYYLLKGSPFGHTVQDGRRPS